MEITMQDRGFSRYSGKDGRNKSGGHWIFDPRLRESWFRQTQLGIDVAQRESCKALAVAQRESCKALAARKHCSPARKAKLLRRAKQAQRELAGEQ